MPGNGPDQIGGAAQVHVESCMQDWEELSMPREHLDRKEPVCMGRAIVHACMHDYMHVYSARGHPDLLYIIIIIIASWTTGNFMIMDIDDQYYKI